MYNDNYNGGGMGGGFSNTDGLGSRDPYARKPMNDMGGMGERRPAQGMMGGGGRGMDNYGQGGGMGGGMGGGNMGGGMGQNNMGGGFDRRNQDNMFSRRDGPAKPM